MKGYQIAIIVIVFFALGYFLSQKAFGSTGKLTDIFGGTPNPDDEYEPGQSYTDPITGGKIECYNLPQEGLEPIAEIYMTNIEPPILGKLYKKTNKTVCYLFPKS